MTQLRMSSSHTAVKLARENDATTDASADGDIDKAVMMLRCSPFCFRKRSCIGIVFDRYSYSELTLKLYGQVAALPSGQRAYITDDPRSWIERSRACDPDSLKLRIFRQDAAKHLCNVVNRVRKSLSWIRRALAPSNDCAVVTNST